MEIREGIELANLSDVGRERENNEDYFCYAEPATDEEFFCKGRLAVIADGMGGEDGGEIASRLAVDSVRREYYACADRDPQRCLIHAFQEAQAAIHEFVLQRPELKDMGTTCTAVSVVLGRAYVGHIGDTRLYLVRGDSILHLTHDHTAVARLVEQGAITAAEAENHPQRNVLTSALSAHRNVSADFSPAPISLELGDSLVLCSDGLWGQIRDVELQSIVQDNAPKEACRKLIQLAKDRGGPDNITVQILRITTDAPTHRASRNGINGR